MPRWSATVAPGLEPVLGLELRHLGVAAERQAGAWVFKAELTEGARLAHRLRTANRLMLDLARGTARNLEDLAILVRSVDWVPYLRMRDTLEIALSAESTRLHHKDSVEKKVRQAIHDALRSRGAPPPDPRRPHLVQRVQVRIVGDTVSLSLDAGGERLGVRGWRASQGKASLRENIAASLLLMAGYGGDEPLLDPFCGSGTIPIEGALIAAGRDPGGRRSYACDAWPVLGHREAPQRGGGRPPAMVYGFDHHGPSLGFAAENAARAGVSVDFRQLDVAELEAPAPTGLVVTNPPWGERLGQRVAGVYARFGETLRGPLRGWRTLFLCPDAGLARRVDPRVQELTSFPLGGSRVSVWALEANP